MWSHVLSLDFGVNHHNSVLLFQCMYFIAVTLCSRCMEGYPMHALIRLCEAISYVKFEYGHLHLTCKVAFLFFCKQVALLHFDETCLDLWHASITFSVMLEFTS